MSGTQLVRQGGVVEPELPGQAAMRGVERAAAQDARPESGAGPAQLGQRAEQDVEALARVVARGRHDQRRIARGERREPSGGGGPAGDAGRKADSGA